MNPPKDVLDRFVWAPLAETGVPLIFAFGARWAKMCSRLGLACEERWGKDGQYLGSPVASRVVETYRVNDRQRVVVSWQSGYAGPPGSEDVERVRDTLAGRYGSSPRTPADHSVHRQAARPRRADGSDAQRFSTVGTVRGSTR